MKSLTCTRVYDECFDCQSCGSSYEHQYELLSTNIEEPEGMCPNCKSEDIKTMRLVTVYQHVWVEQSEEDEETIETALQLEEWQVLDHTIKIKQEEK